jgi:hypothetical protein
METINSKKESLLPAALQKEVKALKEATEISSLKEQIIGAILQVQDKATLEKAAKAVGDALFPKKPGNDGKPETQGNE